MAAYYRATFEQFLVDDPKRVLGVLTAESSKSGFTDHKHKQTEAWQREIEILRTTCESLAQGDKGRLHWSVLLEYPIPRRRGRIDAVILAAGIIFCIEFKTEDKKHKRQTERQVEDYALDLRDFHAGSLGRSIIPIAVAVRAEREQEILLTNNTTDFVRPVLRANATDLAELLSLAVTNESHSKEEPLNADTWDASPYRPVPTIIEAAEALFAGHDVREIAHSHAGAENLTITSDTLVGIIQKAQQEGLKIACFVTGVPGAGKTLAGLSIVHNPKLRHLNLPPTVFLSGNGPLVKIVQKAIARDFGGERISTTLIQNVHNFVRESLEKRDNPPIEHVVLFDEAQRAWNAVQNKKKAGVDISEPETMLSIMDRHPDWAVLIALVGGGQEIHDGEAGLAQWGETLRNRFSHWQIAVSPNALLGDASSAGHRLFEGDIPKNLIIQKEPALHLNVCLRSFRARQTSEWVNSVLNCDSKKAAQVIADVKDFPIALTRSLETAKDWMRQRTRGLRKCGLLASSGALRLRTYGLELSSGFRQGNRDMYVHWFLSESPDIRASDQLEVAASEFECQGLELDTVGVCWGGDFTFDRQIQQWSHRRLNGNKWNELNKEIKRRYLLNSYRVLLTRAREGMIIWVPSGDSKDPTQEPKRFDMTAEYLQSCGLKLV